MGLGRRGDGGPEGQWASAGASDPCPRTRSSRLRDRWKTLVQGGGRSGPLGSWVRVCGEARQEGRLLTCGPRRRGPIAGWLRAAQGYFLKRTQEKRQESWLLNNFLTAPTLLPVPQGFLLPLLDSWSKQSSF